MYLLVAALSLPACGGSQGTAAQNTTATNTTASTQQEQGHPVAEEPPHLEHWSEAHADASRALGEWIRQYPRAARAIFEWDAHNAEHPTAFVHEVANRPEETLDQYIHDHPDVHGFDSWAEANRPATEAFMAWVRQFPQAANALMEHHGGLAWAGEHIYSFDWHLEHPQQAGDAGAATTAAAAGASDAGAAAATGDAAAAGLVATATGDADAGAPAHGHGGHHGAPHSH
jgi:hypothetical protein